MTSKLDKAIQLRKENITDEAFSVPHELLKSIPNDPLVNY